MGYQHIFYALDVDRLKGLYGSGDQAIAEAVIAACGEELEDNDAFFENDIEDGGCPDSATALREILAGAPTGAETPAMYGYVLGILCGHLGEVIGEEVYAVRDHPYGSRLVAAGPPVPIPYDRSDFPEIGSLTAAEIPAEIARIDAAPPRAKRSLVSSLLAYLTSGLLGRRISDEEAVEDMRAYRETLQAALDKGLGVVSLRH